MSQPNPQRDFAIDVVQKLRDAGFEALWAGGCVRDQLLGITPKDYDVATSARPDDIRALFGPRRTLPIGAAFGVITVLGPRPAGQIEVATFRSDAAYSDGRHPDSVTFTTAEHDAERRDFTINGLFFDPVAGEVVDYVGGRDDLERKLIRAIRDPRSRLSEDKLRMLRAVRFAATFGFEIEPDTFAAIQQLAHEITTVSPERIGMEVRRTLVHASRATALELLRKTNLLPLVLPEVADLSPAAWNETLRVLSALDTDPDFDTSLPLALAGLLSSYSPPFKGGDGGGFDEPAKAIVAAIGRRLRYTNKEIDRASWLLTNLPIVSDARNTSWPRLQRILIHDDVRELLALREAVAGADDPALAFCRERLAWPADRLNPPLLVDGAALIAHGLTPGPDFAPLLEAIRDAQLNGDIHTAADALALVDRIRAAGP